MRWFGSGGLTTNNLNQRFFDRPIYTPHFFTTTQCLYDSSDAMPAKTVRIINCARPGVVASL